MSIARQVALVAAPPLASAVIVGAFGAGLGSLIGFPQGGLLSGVAATALIGSAAALSYLSSRRLTAQLAESKNHGGGNQNAAFDSAAFQSTTVALMTVDRDLIVTEINQATRELLASNSETFRKIWPTFNADKIVGTCIDMFHKNPNHQRQLLSDPSRLPYKTEISIDEFKFALHVSAVRDSNGEYIGNVLEWADVTEDRLNSSMLLALDKSQATIEFTLDGKIVDANENFLNTMGYSIDQIRNKHHSVFVERDFKNSPAYKTFWEEIRRGVPQSGEFKRVSSSGDAVWIQGTYNPVLDGAGKPFKVVKFATDITEEVMARSRREKEQKERADAQQLVVSSLASGLRNLSEGDLTSQIDVQFAEEYEELRHNFNSAVSRLHDVMEIISNNAQSVGHGSKEISNASDDLSKRTENQAATLEETAAALDEITATVKLAADNASEANQVASAAQTAANESGKVVGDTISAMEAIESSSKQISQIISVIDDIAFQTNLLALNAGVEAARAGDAGRGFAVVAQEVRALAQRSSDAAKEIKTLITASSRHVETGVDLVGRAGTALHEIVDRVDAINTLIASIAASSKEQADSLSEANSAVNNMDQVTQQNAAMVEETTAACHSLTKDANELLERVSHFNLSNENAGRGKESGATGQTITQQRRRAAAFLSERASGSAALKVQPTHHEDDWQDF